MDLMPQVTAETWVPVPPWVAFDVSQTTGELRLRWDPFIRHQHFLDEAKLPDKGIRTYTKARLGPRMISEYVSYRPPTSVGMVMNQGPWFFRSFAGGWRFNPEERDGTAGTLARWKYTFTTQPAWLRPLGDRLGKVILTREINQRISAFAEACQDPEILAAVGYSA